MTDAEHPAWFKYAEGGPFYMCGPGDPEGFLYRGTRNADGTRTGDQMTLIQKLIGTGANCIYLMAIRSHGGDGDSTHNPYVDSDLSKSLDNDILNQWETWFTAMDNNGIVIFFILYDDSASPFGKELPVNGQLRADEVTFINTIVGRYKHHKHLIWCVAEEYAEGLSAAHAIKVAQQIKLQDDRAHPVAIHQNNGTSFNFNGNPAFDQFAVQWNVATAAQLHSGTVAAWNNVNGRVNINMAEFAPLSTGLELQRKIWAVAMGGGYSMLLSMDIVSTPLADLQTCGRLVRFMEATRFDRTAPRDDLGREDTVYVLADPGEVYIAWGDGGVQFGLSVLPANYAVRWYDPATGIWTDQGTLPVLLATNHSFGKPGSIAADAALYLSRTAPAAAGTPSPPPGATRVRPNVQLSWTAGAGATSHRVHWGLSSPGTFQLEQSANTVTPGNLEHRKTYYWRIDEVNDKGVTTGAVWTFTTSGLPGDADEDEDVDQEDFGRLQTCLSSVDAPAPSSDCLWADLNGDSLVNATDCILFLGCMSGPGVPADPECLLR